MAQQLPHHHLHKSFPAQTPLINQYGMRINSKALNDTQQYWLMLARTPAYDCKFHKSVENSILLYSQPIQQAGCNQSHYASHGFRIGPATTAAAVGLPSWLIQKLGR